MKNNGYIKTVLESLIGINTCTSAGSETIAADYLKEEFARMGVKAIVYEPVIGKGSVVAEIPGRQMASIVLHSHLDTADALDGEWDVPPFRATRIGEKLYGRGAIDSKGLTAVWMGVITVGFPIRRSSLRLQRVKRSAVKPVPSGFWVTLHISVMLNW
jgi:acetylornithine deacetylase/succinyl-diaminopimelate desuccinylase-like protein